MPVVDQAGLVDLGELAAADLVGGVVLVQPAGPDLAGAVASLQASAATGPLVVAVDEEGGTVQRLAGQLGRLPSARSMAEMPIGEVRSLVADHAAGMAALGVTMNLAPVVDVGAGPGIGSRSFSDDPLLVAAFGSAVAYGVMDAGLTPVAKHFPGHGRASADSHDVLPATPPMGDMYDLDLVPWRYIPPGTAVMVGHLAVPGLTDGQPASLSHEAVTELLRGELGFDGLVLSDDLSMGAVADEMYVAEAAVRSLSAGVDLLIVGPPAGVGPASDGLVAAVGDGRLATQRLDEAVGRVLEERGVDPCSPGGH